MSVKRPNKEQSIEQSGFKRAMSQVRAALMPQRAAVGDVYMLLIEAKTDDERAKYQALLDSHVATLQRARLDQGV